MKKLVSESDSRGPYGGMALISAEPVVLKLQYYATASMPLSDRSSYTMGNASKASGIYCEDEELAVADEDPKDLGAAQMAFAEKIKSIIANAIKGDIRGKIIGPAHLVNIVVELINFDKRYILDLMSGKAADDPAMIKLKANIDKQAAALERLSGLKWIFN